MLAVSGNPKAKNGLWQFYFVLKSKIELGVLLKNFKKLELLVNASRNHSCPDWVVC